jgi:hypothetical protein
MRHTEFLGKVGQRNGAYKTVSRSIERLAHVYAPVDTERSVYYTVNGRVQVEAGRLLGQEDTASLTDERPEGRPLTKAALLDGPGQEDGVYHARKQKEPAPAASEKPAYTIVKQTKSRWWEVRDSDDELVCLTVYRKGATEVYDGSPPEKNQDETRGSRGREPCGCRDACPAA